MELEKCSCGAIGENVCCCKTEPFEGSENLEFKSAVKNYDDYLNNKRFLEYKTQECNDRYNFCQRQERANMEMLKNLFLSEFVGSEKQINGICIHENKFTKDPYHDYLYIIDVRPNGIFDGGLYVSAIHIHFREENGELMNIVFRQENSYLVSYETLCSCRITKQEFMTVYNKAHDKIMEPLGYIRVDSE